MATIAQEKPAVGTPSNRRSPAYGEGRDGSDSLVWPRGGGLIWPHLA